MEKLQLNLNKLYSITNALDINKEWVICSCVLLALLIQQVKQTSGLLADEVDAAHVVCVVDVVPRDSLCLVLLLRETGRGI